MQTQLDLLNLLDYMYNDTVNTEQAGEDAARSVNVVLRPRMTEGESGPVMSENPETPDTPAVHLNQL
jgi:hypothetical protein